MKLSDIVNRINGNVDRFTTDLEYYIGGEHFESNELEITKKGKLKENLGQLGFKFHFAFQDRDVIFMARNPHLRKAGMVHFSGLCSDASYILRSKDESIITQEFLAIQLQSDHFWDYCESHKVGSVNFANNWSSIANYEFELPPLSEQKLLAEKVWAAYKVKQSYIKMIEATDEMVKSQFLEMFGDPTTCKNGKKGKELFSFASGKANTKSNLDPSFQYNCYGGNGITGKSKDFLLKNKTIVIGRVGEYCGCVHQTSDYCWITDNAIYLKSYDDSYRFQFIYYMFTMMDFHRFASETGQPKITQAPLLSCIYPVPSLDDQDKYICIAQQADKSKFELRKSIEAIDKVIKSLINENL